MYNNNFYPNNYGSYQQPQSGGIIWVQGEAGAKSFLVAPGQSVILLDSERPTFYIKSTDASGMPQPLKIYDFTERTEQAAPSQGVDLSQYVTKNELKEIIAGMKKEDAT